MNNINVTVVIPTKNRYFTTLPLTIQSIINQTYKPHKLLLIDDNEQKLDLRDNEQYSYLFALLDTKGIKWEVVFASGKGIAHNHQLSIEKCNTDWLWRIDDDCIADINVLETLVDSIDDKTGAVACCIINPKGNLPPSELVSNKIEDYIFGGNEQWYIPEDKSIKQVDHLYSSFLYRRSAALKNGYNLNLSPVGHCEETWFTYQLKRNGWDIKINPNCIIHHLHNSQGGIRSYKNQELWNHDAHLFDNQLKEWSVVLRKPFSIMLDNGIGDHFAFKSILNDIKNKYNDHVLIIACVYPEVFRDIQDDNIKLISIDEGIRKFGDIDKYNVYKYLSEHENLTLIEAFRRIYE